MNLRAYAVIGVLLACLPAVGQFERTHINFQCPCTLSSTNGETATVTFGLVNYTESVADGLYATVAIAGDRETTTGLVTAHSAYVDTIVVGVEIEPESTIEPMSLALDLGAIPEGAYFFELLLHNTETPSEDGMLDSIWFKGEVDTPPASLNLIDANYLLDSDEDGIADINEENAGTDPFDSNSFPPTPVVDILVLHEDLAFEHYATNPQMHMSHLLALTNFMFEKSESPVFFRPVGLLDSGVISELGGSDALPESRYQELMDEYQADIVAVFRNKSPVDDFLCGFAVSIGGIQDKGFLHPNERFAYTEIFLDPGDCSADTTAHEIGHLMGLGHSYVQQSIGAFPWSRGHGVYGEFGTIMTYAESFYNAIGVDGFSNPDLDCFGKPCGVSHHDHNSHGSANASLTLNILKYQFAETSSPSADFDYDGDGFSAIDDAFPIDPTEWADSDGDQFGDNVDAFPENPLEWADTDGDGIGNNTDPDIDDDGILNHVDLDPFDAEISQPRFVSVRSHEPDDSFGYYSTQINDFNKDGLNDLAISAPTAGAVADDSLPSGKVYLLSLADVIEPLDASSTTPGSKSLTDLVAFADTWVLHGHPEDTFLGSQLATLQHSDATSELIIASENAFYLLELDTLTLAALDAEDGGEDREIHLDHCNSQSGCTYINAGNGLSLLDVAAIGDLDDDGLADIGAVSSVSLSSQTTELRIQFISRDGLTTVTSGAGDGAMTLSEVHDLDSTSFMLSTTTDLSFREETTTELSFGQTTAADLSFGDLESLGTGAADDREDLVLAIPGDERFGRLYILSIDQLRRFHEIDGAIDRQLDIDRLIASSQTYRVTAENNPYFGYGVNSLSDIDNDARDDVMVWGGASTNYVLSIAGIRFHDFSDRVLDGIVRLGNDAATQVGTWQLNRLARFSPLTSSTILRGTSGSIHNALVSLGPDYRSMLWAELNDLDYLDDPTEVDFNGIVNLPIRIRYPGIYFLRVPYGPNGYVQFSGSSSLGDLDKDGSMDLAFTMLSGEFEGTVSTTYFVFSSELAALDRADGDTDHIVMLHNDLSDSDDDGIPNLHDNDDDNDGLRDLFDEYPVLNQYKYDADYDGYANANDAFPLDYNEHADIDFDGIADGQDDDADGDGILNEDDEFPYDSDNDGLPNEKDPDDDNDLVLDVDDQFPLDPTESVDSDGDGYGDNVDAFAQDPLEWLDTDGDGIGNNTDDDDDGDGYLDVDDAFPLLATEWLDSDGDGVGDNSDVFPNDPLEWEDKDGDGIGDNFGSTQFTSHRLVSEWHNLSGSLTDIFEGVSVETFRLGDFNRDGLPDLEISNALPHTTGQPMILLSGADLQMLDELDGKADRAITLNDAHQGPTSWRFVNPRIGFDSLRFSVGSVGDINEDGLNDILIANPQSYNNSGSAVVVYGGNWAELDALDGEADGEINLHECTTNDACARLRSTSTFHGFGLIVGLTANIFGNEELSLALGTTHNQSRRIGRSGLGAAYLIAHSALSSTSTSDSLLVLDDLLNDDRSLAFYPEFDSFFPGFNATAVARVPDFDGDGVNELILNVFQNTTQRVYVIASSDLEGMDMADFQNDGKINLFNAYKQPNSYRIDGFLLHPSSFLNSNVEEAATAELSQHLLPLLNLETTEMHLIDIKELEEHDRADGPPNGVITELEQAADRRWSFPNMERVSICRPDESTGRVQGIATYTGLTDPRAQIDEFQLYVFDVRNLSALDSSDGASDGTINLDQSINQGVADTWSISFGSLDDSSQAITITCAGDLDQDGQEDFAVTMKNVNGDNARSHVFLLTYEDLVVLDKRDEQQDYKVDVSELWPSE